MASNKVYIAVANKSSKVVIIRGNTAENKEFLKTQMGDECTAFKVRAVTTEEAFNKIKKQLNMEDLTLDTTRHHNLAEIEEFVF